MSEVSTPYSNPLISLRISANLRRGIFAETDMAENHHHHGGGSSSSNNLQGCAGLLPLYDPSLISSDLLTCAVKEEGFNLMGYVDGSSSSTASHNNPYLDPNSNFSPFMYNLREFDQSCNNGSEIIGFKHEPLSLSLSSHHTHHSNVPLELNLQRYGSSLYGGGDRVCGNVPVGPFTGYASILKGSRFLKPAQALLEEICDVGRGIYVEKLKFDSSLIDPSIECLGGNGIGGDDDPLLNCVDVGGGGGDHGKKKSKLISLLDEVYKRYKQYYQHMQSVVESFEYVAGLGNAAPYANLALKAMYKHFKCLKNAIIDQLQLTDKGHTQISPGKDEDPRIGNGDRAGFYGQRPVNNSGFVEHQPVWRPQRGLPERAVAVLRAWLFEHFLHPYPTDTDKIMLAKQTGLSRSQVSNWFINARVRLWKPMVEEIHMLETRQTQKASQRDERNPNRSSDHLPLTNTLPSNIPSTSTQWLHDTPPKRTRNKLPDIPAEAGEPLNLSYSALSSHPHIGVGVSIAGGNSSVSLTLGLHQNNATGLSEPFPINAAQRLGIPSSDNYVMGNFGVQNRLFGRDSIGGQLLHDFVG